jgi:hypothetical protein
MEPLVLPARAGWQWITLGFQLFRAYAALWLLLLFFYWMALITLSSVPVIGAVAALVLMPGISGGLMVACEAASRRQPPSLRHIFEPLARNRKAQLQLGMVYLAGSALALGASALVDGGTFFKGPPRAAERAQMMREFPAYIRGMATAMAVFTPAMLALWFAPALVHWRNMSPGKALFFSFFACVRNWRAFLVYGLGLGLLFILGPMVIGALLALLLTADMRGITVASFVVMPYLFVVMGAMACSFYVTWRTVFPEPPREPGNEPAKENPANTPVDAEPGAG